jgi:hypothetical protein
MAITTIATHQKPSLKLENTHRIKDSSESTRALHFFVNLLSSDLRFLIVKIRSEYRINFALSSRMGHQTDSDSPAAAREPVAPFLGIPFATPLIFNVLPEPIPKEGRFCNRHRTGSDRKVSRWKGR